VNAEKVIDLDRIRITQKVTLREAPRYNRNTLQLEVRASVRLMKKLKSLSIKFKSSSAGKNKSNVWAN
jgi:hypothetical protein